MYSTACKLDSFQEIYGGHFEIQDGCHKIHKKKWNQPQFCSMGSK